jgi:hypothetical protein
LLGALALLYVGAVHLQQYQKLYSVVPTIGPLFLVNFAVATVRGVALLAPVDGWVGRWGGALVALAAAGGLGLAAGSRVLLTVAERRPLFGFREPGYDPAAIAASRRSRCMLLSSGPPATSSPRTSYAAGAPSQPFVVSNRCRPITVTLTASQKGCT